MINTIVFDICIAFPDDDRTSWNLSLTHEPWINYLQPKWSYLWTFLLCICLKIWKIYSFSSILELEPICKSPWVIWQQMDLIWENILSLCPSMYFQKLTCIEQSWFSYRKSGDSAANNTYVDQNKLLKVQSFPKPFKIEKFDSFSLSKS